MRLVDERLAIASPDHVRVLADVSVTARTKTAIAAYAMPVCNVMHSGRLHVFTMSRTTALVAIKMALEYLRTLDHPHCVVLLTDSRSALF